LSRSCLVGGFRHTRRFLTIFFASLPLPTAFSSSMKASSRVASRASFSKVSVSKSIASKADMNLIGICFEPSTSRTVVNRLMIASWVSSSTPAKRMLRRFRSIAMKGKLRDFTRSCHTSAQLPRSESCVSHVIGTGIRSFSPHRSGSKCSAPSLSSPVALNSCSVSGYFLRRTPQTLSAQPLPTCTARMSDFRVNGRVRGS